jgi:hypothetical protein
MRLLVWNMGSGGPGGSAAGHERAWRYLLEEQQFDVALLQETRRPPDWVSDCLRSVAWSPKYARHQAASASARRTGRDKVQSL